MKVFRVIILVSFVSIMPIQFLVAQNSKKRTSIDVTRYSEEHALECVRDYYDFYHADECYNEPRVRRISNNVFYVSVRQCSGGRETGKHWNFWSIIMGR